MTTNTPEQITAPAPAPKGKRKATNHGKIIFPKTPYVAPRDFDTAGCIQLVGQVVKIAIQDACISSTHCRSNQFFKENAEDFLFAPDQLERYFRRYGLEGCVNCDYIRREAKKVIAGERTLDEIGITQREETEENEEILDKEE